METFDLIETKIRHSQGMRWVWLVVILQFSQWVHGEAKEESPRFLILTYPFKHLAMPLRAIGSRLSAQGYPVAIGFRIVDTSLLMFNDVIRDKDSIVGFGAMNPTCWILKLQSRSKNRSEKKLVKLSNELSKYHMLFRDPSSFSGIFGQAILGHLVHRMDLICLCLTWYSLIILRFSPDFVIMDESMFDVAVFLQLIKFPFATLRTGLYNPCRIVTLEDPRLIPLSSWERLLDFIATIWTSLSCSKTFELYEEIMTRAGTTNMHSQLYKASFDRSVVQIVPWIPLQRYHSPLQTITCSFFAPNSTSPHFLKQWYEIRKQIPAILVVTDVDDVFFQIDPKTAKEISRQLHDSGMQVLWSRSPSQVFCCSQTSSVVLTSDVPVSQALQLPNIQVFVSFCVEQMFLNAIYAGKPLICIETEETDSHVPRLVQFHKIGKVLQISELHLLSSIIKEVAIDSSLASRVLYLSKQFKSETNLDDLSRYLALLARFTQLKQMVSPNVYLTRLQPIITIKYLELAIGIIALACLLSIPVQKALSIPLTIRPLKV